MEKKLDVRPLHGILIVYLIFSIIFPFLFKTNIYSFFIKPIMWVGLTIFLYFKKENNHGRFNKLKENRAFLLIITLTYIIIYFLLGLFCGFNKNPYSVKILSLLRNFWQILVVIVCIEYVRSAVVNENRKDKKTNAILAIIFVAYELNMRILFGNFSNYEGLFKYVSSTILPMIFSSFLYNYLTEVGSYKLVLVFRLIVETILLIVPIVPAFDWFVEGIIGILTPVVIYILFRRRLDRFHKKLFSRVKTRTNVLLYIPFFGIIIVFVLFMTGFFVYEPVAMLSNSMYPAFQRGDVIIYKKLTTSELKSIEKYTIILYSKDKQTIAHRVIDKYEEEGKVYYITKGDANNTPDAHPVGEEQIIGVYSFSIKYIGYPSVWLNQIFNHETPSVEIK